MTIDQFAGSVRIFLGCRVMRREHDGATLLIFSKRAQQFKDHLGIAPIELASRLIG